METDTVLILLLAAALYNAVVFIVYWWDKAAARANRRRISEAQLLTLAFFGGSPGALMAQRIFRHKTQKQPFRRYLKTIAVLHGIIVLGLAGYFVSILVV
ncbi:DUF1294 domain-containing protein [Agrobacterium sp. ES01]|uniref:DUF1294 domain-containing protein n=1 Tax=Agrobacterium sp. ES01 TaxID=3420714 RepID=UPI003D0C0CB9